MIELLLMSLYGRIKMSNQDELHEFMKLANKQFGENTAIILDEDNKIKTDVVPTGIAVIDNAIGVGGIPRGRFTEIFGEEGCGKTTLCLHAITEAQKLGLNAAFIDAEHALTIERMIAIGVDTSKLVFSQPDSGEDALNLVEMMVRSEKFAIIVVDSVAALVPQAEIEKDMGESVMGVQARLLSQAMRKLTAPVSRHNVALVFTNQMRAKLGGYMPSSTTTGGNALKFYASLRLKMQLTGRIKDSSGKQVSGKYRMTCIKNKMAVPYREAEFEIGENGIDDETFFVDELITAGVIEKAGAFLKYNGTVVAQGKKAFVEVLKEQPSLKEELLNKMKEK